MKTNIIEREHILTISKLLKDFLKVITYVMAYYISFRIIPDIQSLGIILEVSVYNVIATILAVVDILDGRKITLSRQGKIVKYIVAFGLLVIWLSLIFLYSYNEEVTLMLASMLPGPVVGILTFITGDAWFKGGKDENSQEPIKG